MASRPRRYQSGNRSDGSSSSSSPASSDNFSNANQGNNNNAPKFGTPVPNRIFVGGISSTTTEEELSQLFRKYGNVKATKIIVDRAGVSKGYGFITFETAEEANLLKQDADNIVFKERRLNIAPAIKKQYVLQASGGRSFDSPTSPPPSVPLPSIYYQNGVPFQYHNGMAFFAPTGGPPVAALPTPQPEPVYHAYAPQPPPASYSPTMLYSCANPSPHIYMSAQYPYQQMPMANGPQYIYNGTVTPSTGRSSPVNSPDITSAIIPPPPPPPLPPLPPTQAFYPPTYQTPVPEYCYPPNLYPLYTMIPSQDSYIQYNDVSQSMDYPGSNMSSEDASSTASLSVSERTTPGVPQTSALTSENSSASAQNARDTATPVVSLLALEQNGEERDRSVRPCRRLPPPLDDSFIAAEELPVPVPKNYMVFYHSSTALYNPPASIPTAAFFNRSNFPQSRMFYQTTGISPVRNGPNLSRGGRGIFRGRGQSSERVNFPQVPKFPTHFNNNNPSITNNNYYTQTAQDYSPGHNLVQSGGGGRGGKNNSRGSHFNSQPSPSPPPAPYSPMARPYTLSGSNPSISCSTPPPQIPQQFMQPRTFYPGPPSQKRFHNNPKKTNGFNNQASTPGNYRNYNNKYKGHQAGGSTVGKHSLGGAGDAPPNPASENPSPAPSPNQNLPNEMMTQMKTLTLN